MTAYQEGMLYNICAYVRAGGQTCVCHGSVILHRCVSQTCKKLIYFEKNQKCKTDDSTGGL